MAQLEDQFRVTRSQQVDPDANRYLSDLLPKLDIAEVMITDEYGYNAVTTSPSSDFVQSDEGWWQTAWNNGFTTAQATADAATQRVVVELAGVIRDRGTKIGVVKVKFGLAHDLERRLDAARRSHRLGRQGHRQLGGGGSIEAVQCLPVD